MRIVRIVAKPYLASGWKVGGSGLKRRADSGHWAHCWFDVSGLADDTLFLGLRYGTISPYLLSVFNRQPTDRAPASNFIAIHSSIQPVSVVMVTSRAEVEEAAWRLVLDPDDVPEWLSAQFELFLPQLEELSSDSRLLEWLSDPVRSPNSSQLRYAAFLAHHLRSDDELRALLSRAETSAQLEDAATLADGGDLSYRLGDGQTTHPQDWSHERFLEFLGECPRDIDT